MSKSNKVTGDYAKACVEAATEAGAQCVDFYTEMMKAGEVCDQLSLFEVFASFFFLKNEYQSSLAQIGCC